MEGKQTVVMVRSILGIIATLIVAAFTVAPTFAVDYGAGNVQEYGAAAPINNGTIVQLDKTTATNVDVATSKNIQNMFGVTIDPGQLLVTTNNTLPNEVYVAVSGTYDVLVSTEGGTIAKGDYITISSVDGVGMKADNEVSTVFGRAEGSFNGQGAVLGTMQLKTTAGVSKGTTNIGEIPVAIDVQHNPTIKTVKQNIPQLLQKIGIQIADHPVSMIRIYLSLAISVASIIVVIVILYSGVRSGVISIGRNPMSKKSIFRALIQIIITSILILVIGFFAVYLLLKL